MDYNCCKHDVEIYILDRDIRSLNLNFHSKKDCLKYFLKYHTATYIHTLYFIAIYIDIMYILYKLDIMLY